VPYFYIDRSEDTATHRNLDIHASLQIKGTCLIKTFSSQYASATALTEITFLLPEIQKQILRQTKLLTLCLRL